MSRVWTCLHRPAQLEGHLLAAEGGDFIHGTVEIPIERGDVNPACAFRRTWAPGPAALGHSDRGTWAGWPCPVFMDRLVMLPQQRCVDEILGVGKPRCLQGNAGLLAALLAALIALWTALVEQWARPASALAHGVAHDSSGCTSTTTW